MKFGKFGTVMTFVLLVPAALDKKSQMTYARFKAAFVIGLFLAGIPGLVNAQGEYSMAGANRYFAQKDWPDLLAYSRAWTRANPNDAMAWYYLGQTYRVGFNQPVAAARAIRRAVSIQQQWPEAWQALATVLLELKQYEQAIAAAKQAASEWPEHPNNWNTLAAAYSEIQDAEHVIQTLREEQQHMSHATSYDWYNLGNGYASALLYREAIAAYNQSLRRKSDFADVWNNRGVAEEALRQNASALADYQRAAALGDSGAGENYSNLKQAIAAAQQGGNESGSGATRRHCQAFYYEADNGKSWVTKLVCH